MNELVIDITEKKPVRSFKVPVKSFSDFTFEIRQITVDEVDVMKLSYTDKVKAGKTFISVENEERREKILKEAIVLNIVGWSNIVDPSGNKVLFSPENLKSLLSLVGGVRVNQCVDNDLTDEKENKSLLVWLFEQATNGENFTGTAKNL